MKGNGKTSRREKSRAPARPGTYVALDVGSSKVACIIARVEPGKNGERAQTKMVSVGHQLSRGMRSGAVTDMDRAGESIRAAVETAENMADTTVNNVFISFSCGEPKSITTRGETPIAHGEVSVVDIKRALQAARLKVETGEREIVHSIPLGYAVDGTPKIIDPRGMFGSALGASVHVMTAAPGPLQNLELCVENCHLRIAGRAFSAYAAGLSCLVSDEMNLGATVIDMGGGVTSIAVFAEGALVHADTIAIGGDHITRDVAHGLSTSMRHAERLKTIHGSAIPGPADERELISVPLMGEDESEESNQIPRVQLTRIVQPRLEETFELIRERLSQSGVADRIGRRVVLTGGASQMTGLREFAGRVLERQVRLGRPLKMQGLAEIASGPAFAACAGLVHFAQAGGHEGDAAQPVMTSPKSSAFGRFGAWVKENLL